MQSILFIDKTLLATEQPADNKTITHFKCFSHCKKSKAFLSPTINSVIWIENHLNFFIFEKLCKFHL